MNGPGIYKITFNPTKETWKMIGPNKTTSYPIHTVEFIKRHYPWDSYYRVFIDSTGNNPAYTTGSNLIKERMREDDNN